MLICPDCQIKLRGQWESSSCACGWKLEHVDGIPDLRSSFDRTSPLVGRYEANYEEIANDDLELTIQGDRYLTIQAERLFSYLGPVKGRSVCEIGIGQGRAFDRILAEGPAKLVGLDIALPYLRRYAGDERVRVAFANAETLPFADEFDLIVAADIFEHVLNVGDALLCANRALRPGGRLVIKVPYKEDLTQYARGQRKYELVHLRDFNRENLRRLLRAGGFEVESMHYDGFVPYRRRKYIGRSRFLNNRFDAWVDRLDDQHDTANVPSWLGRLLMRPAEITASGIKGAT